MAAELETALDESSHLVQSHGGVFEVEQEGQLIFSKRACGRFPEDGEILRILHGLDQGLTIELAQSQAAKDVKQPPSFGEWLARFWKKNRSSV